MEIIKSTETPPIVDYLYEAVSDQVKLKELLVATLFQGDLCDFSVTSMDGRHIDCHLLIIGVFSPYIMTIVEETGGDCLILPDFRTSEIASLMNLIYSGK
jgi:hypothetical protein